MQCMDFEHKLDRHLTRRIKMHAVHSRLRCLILQGRKLLRRLIYHLRLFWIVDRLINTILLFWNYEFLFLSSNKNLWLFFIVCYDRLPSIFLILSNQHQYFFPFILITSNTFRIMIKFFPLFECFIEIISLFH
jgi:hypothetical protein